MTTKHIRASELVKHIPSAECCDCANEPDDTQENSIWTIWYNNIYCPKCAKYEGVGPQ